MRMKTSLRTLDLSVNKLAALPPSIGELTLLKSLNISSNRLSEIHRVNLITHMYIETPQSGHLDKQDS